MLVKSHSVVTSQKSYNKYLIVVAFFGLYFILGFFVHDDYGISSDETINRRNGLVSAKYIIEELDLLSFKSNPALQNVVSLHAYRDKDYGVVFELPLLMVEKAAGIQDNNSPQLWHLRHFCTFLVFYLGVVFFFLLVQQRFNNWKLSLLGSSFLIISPRIFAESFYNGKDVVFLSFFIIATFFLVKFLRKKTLLNAVALGLIAALTTDIRILGILIPCVTIFFVFIDTLKFLDDRRVLRNNLINTTVFLASFLLLTVLFWPYLWESPVNNFLGAFRNMSKFRWNNEVLYLGQHIRATKLPWHYIPVWIGITTPILYTLLFFIGTGVIVWQLVLKLPRLYDSNEEQQDLLMLCLFLGPLLAVIVMQSVLYDGWRQMYFLYGSFLMLALRGLLYLVDLGATSLKNKRLGFSVALNASVLLLCPTIYWMIKNHPYQNVYFNLLAGRSIEQRFERDYWGLSYRQALEFVAKTDKRENLVISVNLKPGKSNINMLSKEDQERISKVEYDYLLAPRKANYYITEFRYRGNNSLPGKEVFNIQVDGFKIIGVWKIR